MTEHNQPIAVFDSGIGGLTVVRHLLHRLPDRSILYFGDSARVPYGSKSDETVRSYTRQASRMLAERGVGMMTIACNTASAVALDVAVEEMGVPVIGMIEPGARAAIEATKTGRIGVIGTRGTIRSGAYDAAIRSLDPNARVFPHACPLFVGIAEEGMTDHPVTTLMVEEYLAPLLEQAIDTLVLGCTHYPILSDAIARGAGDEVCLIDPGAAAAELIADTWTIENRSDFPAHHHYILSDLPDRFIEIGERFLGQAIESVEKIGLEELTGRA